MIFGCADRGVLNSGGCGLVEAAFVTYESPGTVTASANGRGYAIPDRFF